MKYGLLVGIVATFAASSSGHALVVNGGFEDLSGGYVSTVVNGSPNIALADLDTAGEWGVFSAVTGWTAVGTGIEIQASGTAGLTSQGGSGHHVELDAHGGSSNSGMYQDIFLDVGNYAVRFFYRARVATAGRAETNGIDFGLSGMGATIFGGPLSDSIATSNRADWIEHVYDFRITTAGTVRLSFFATGTADTYGGLIDTVGITRKDDFPAIPLPAGIWLLGSGLAGLGAATRRRLKTER